MSWRNESALVNAICKAIEREHPDVWILKVHGGPYQRAGVPDLLLCWEGLFIGMEVKHQKPGETEQGARERATLLQRSEIGKINKAGGLACVVLTPDEALGVIERAKRKHSERGRTDGGPGRDDRGGGPR